MHIAYYLLKGELEWYTKSSGKPKSFCLLVEVVNVHHEQLLFNVSRRTSSSTHLTSAVRREQPRIVSPAEMPLRLKHWNSVRLNAAD